MSEKRSRRRWLPTFSVRTLSGTRLRVRRALLYLVYASAGNVIQPEHLVQIDVDGTFSNAPIRGLYLVDPDGYVNLGAVYGKVKVAGMTGDEAQAALLVHLKQWLISPRVTISIAGWRRNADADVDPAKTSTRNRRSSGGTAKHHEEVRIFANPMIPCRAVLVCRRATEVRRADPFASVLRTLRRGGDVDLCRPAGERGLRRGRERLRLVWTKRPLSGDFARRSSRITVDDNSRNTN